MKAKVISMKAACKKIATACNQPRNVADVTTGGRIPENVINRWAHLTDINDHGGVLQEISKYFGYRLYERLFAHINADHLKIGYLPGRLSDIRYYLYNRLLSRINTDFGPEILAQVDEGL